MIRNILIALAIKKKGFQFHDENDEKPMANSAWAKNLARKKVILEHCLLEPKREGVKSRQIILLKYT